ncbi:hypothetical protein [Pseudomonas sp. RGB]|uniref:hypothetical protein n=1 Tax=Pseudomonas sp. RGB TaxID=2598474 RepID=UPI001196EB6D|nr:hypothetical protein [Pseudomonas sp. RGB]TVT90830.1 hypothetical protein FPT15_13460 [Pseudomonas sp. RGB]
MIEVLICAIKEIPNVVWSGVIAAFIALSGVWASNRGNNKRLSLQLTHDAQEKSKERIHALRSEVYLAVMEYIEITNIHLSSLSNRDLTKSDMSLEMQVIGGAMAKLRLVAEAETSKIATELGMAFGSAFLKLIFSLAPLQKEKVEIEINNDFYNEAHEEAKALQRDIDKIIQSGKIDYLRLQALQSAFDFKRKQTNEYASARAHACIRRSVELEEFNRILMIEMKSLTEVQLRLMIAARSDLDLTSNSQELRKQLELQWSVMQAAYESSIKSMKD